MVVFYVIHHRGSEKITIQALRGEGDFAKQNYTMLDNLFLSTPCTRMVSVSLEFLSTPSVGRATPRGTIELLHNTISIHALRGEGDAPAEWLRYVLTNFYPRPPWGGRRREGEELPRRGLFLSTPSVGRATHLLFAAPLP